MAAPEHFVPVAQQGLTLEQRDGAGFGRAIYRKRAHIGPSASVPVQAMRLNLSKSGRGLRSKMLAGAP